MNLVIVCVCVLVSSYTIEAAFSVQNESPLGETCRPSEERACGQQQCSDGRCPESQKCCLDKCNVMTCGEPVFKTKPGTCPNTENVPSADCKSKWSCHYDGQCHGEQKCCKHPCGKVCSMVTASTSV